MTQLKVLQQIPTNNGDALIEHMDEKDACYDQSLNLYPAGFPTMEYCMHFCQNLGGSRVPPVNTLLQWERVHTYLIENQVREKVWLPVDDSQNEGKWRDYYDHQVLNYTLPWNREEPNGGKGENCVVTGEKYRMRWNDGGCDYSKAICLCERDLSLHLRLRGLCSNSAIDNYYRPMNDFVHSKRFYLVGRRKSTIQYDEMSKQWNLHVSESNVTGMSYAAHHTFALGKHEWSIVGDSGCRVKDGEYIRHLKLTGCDTREFTCDDGQCVTMEQRCDQLSDCRDKSDETNCKVLVLSKEYNKNVPPISVDYGIKKMVNVSVSIDLSKLVDIDEEDYSVEMQFSITLEWLENRATYQNLKKDRSLNALTEEDIKLLWLPKVIYESTDQKESTRLGTQWEWGTSIVVERKRNGTSANLEAVDETELFKGDQNSLVMFQTYTHKFQCIFNLKKYPFDKQTCSIDMAMGPLDWTSVSLNPGQLYMNQSLQMQIFEIIDWKLQKDTYGIRRPSLKMTLVLKRMVMSELMTTYFPTLLLTAITFATTFFKPFFFEAALSVNLTTMLVMTTIFISKMESLPQTSYIKMIDIWLILCQIYPFVEVVLLTAMEYQRGEKNDEKTDILIVQPSSMADQRNDSKPFLGKFVDFVSRWEAPGLKTIGGLTLLCLLILKKTAVPSHYLKIIG